MLNYQRVTTIHKAYIRAVALYTTVPPLYGPENPTETVVILPNLRIWLDGAYRFWRFHDTSSSPNSTFQSDAVGGIPYIYINICIYIYIYVCKLLTSLAGFMLNILFFCFFSVFFLFWFFISKSAFFFQLFWNHFEIWLFATLCGVCSVSNFFLRNMWGFKDYFQYLGHPM